MKIYLLTPNFKLQFTLALIGRLKGVGQVIIEKKPKAFSKVKGLFDPGEKVVAIDPDFCQWSVKDEVIKKLPEKTAICLQSTSFSWVNVDLAAKKRIVVTDTRDFSTQAVAERAMMMALNLACKIPLLVKEGWKKDFDRYRSIELKGKTAGIIGLGRIGRTVAGLCRGLNMDVVYWSRHTRDKKFFLVSLPKLLAQADVLFVALAKNDGTKGLITDKLLRTIKPQAIFISVAPIFTGDKNLLAYNHQFVLNLVKSKRLYGYGFEDESGGTFNKYRGNVWAEPVLAWASAESLKRNAENWVQTIVDAAHGEYPNRVN